jgi:flavin-dependent dehydrogenase
MEDREIIVIGAGPAGSVASSLLKRAGHDVVVLERESFPRFSIGESLLPHCLDLVAEAGMIGAVDAAGFQPKNGAAFARGDYYADFDFGQQYSRGRATAFQVPRARFDQLLADGAERQGVEIRYRTEIAAVDFSSARPVVATRDAAGNDATLRADFVLDASGFGRCLARHLELERPSPFPVRQALFTHVADGIPRGGFDRQKIRVVVHPRHRDVWFWLIPFSGGRSSLGVVARPEFLAGFAGTPEARLRALVAEDGGLADLLGAARWDTAVREITGYSASVSTLHGRGFALLGNAAEFLDPVFSSGVTIAMRSASMAAAVLHRQLGGERVDWDEEFSRPLLRGVDVFRAYVEAWYDGRFQDIAFCQDPPARFRAMICSVLAGYVWDVDNPFVTDARRRLAQVAQLCAAGSRAGGKAGGGS